MARKLIKVLFIPGNHGGTPRDNWFPYLKRELEKFGLKVIAEDFPDNILAREKFWLPHIKKLEADAKTILVGHSSGAVAAMRFAEKNKILGSVLVGACYTDLGDEDERKSGYYNRPWNWGAIKKNQEWIIQFASKDDPWIPIAESRYIHKKLNTEYFEYEKGGHFGVDREYRKLPKLVEVIKTKAD